MNTMKRDIPYKGFKISFVVDLNTLVERRMNGNRYHTVEVTCSDNMYNRTFYKVEDSVLVKTVEKIEQDVKDYIDDKLKGLKTPDERLHKLGFK